MRTFLKSGHPHVEFNVKVASYAERFKLALMNPLATDVNHWLGDGRAGLNLELIGHGSLAPFYFRSPIFRTFSCTRGVSLEHLT